MTTITVVILRAAGGAFCVGYDINNDTPPPRIWRLVRIGLTALGGLLPS